VPGRPVVHDHAQFAKLGQGGGGGRHPALGIARLGEDERAGREPEHLPDERVGGHAERDAPIGEDQGPDLPGQSPRQPMGAVAGEDQRDRSRPGPPSQPASQRRDVGHPVGHLARLAQEQRQRARRVQPLDPTQPRHRRRAQRAGGQAVDGLRRQPDDPPLRQAGHRAMDHVARVVGLGQVDAFRQSRRFGHRFRGVKGKDTRPVRHVVPMTPSRPTRP
jgi:hypothetical protein